jgi:hypothetical protein
MARFVLTVILAVLVIGLVASGYQLMRAKDKTENGNGDGENGHN